MIENNFEGYIDIFIFYILLINYVTFMGQILIFDSAESKRQLSYDQKKIIFIIIFFSLSFFINLEELRYVGKNDDLLS